MRRLAGSDGGFLFIESASQASTCVDVAVLAAPSEGTQPLTRQALVRHLAERLHCTPGLRRRLVTVPFGLGHPVWVDDPDLDLDAHVRQVTVPAPGGDAELDAVVADALPELLARDVPLWRVTLVGGLAGGRQALVFQFHHALADGTGLANTLAALLDDGVAAAAPDLGEAAPAAAPARPVLLVRTAARQLLAWLVVPLLLVRTLRRFRAVERRRRETGADVPRPVGDAPRTVLNRSADARRVFARVDLPLADVRRVRQGAGTTVSDVVLAVVAGGLRDHLADREELPDVPLVVNVPVGEAVAETRTTGNVFANYFARLATDEPDPRRRLARTATANAQAKELLEVLGRRTLTAWLDRIPPALAGPAARRMAARQRTGEAPPDFNVLVSNMRLPGSPWTFRGRPVERVWMSGPAADGAGLNITVTGYGDRLGLALVANPSAVAEPAELALRLREALDQLVAATADDVAGRDVADRDVAEKDGVVA